MARGSKQQVKDRKQAVVIVHGMGEQKPLDTLRSFVHAVWDAKPTPPPHHTDNDVWLVPDRRVGLKELARVTTRTNREAGEKKGLQTDFYELYWSDLMGGNTLSHIRTWLTGLLLRWPHQVPRETVGVWLSLWAVTLFVITIALWVGLSNPLQALRDTFALEKPTHDAMSAWKSFALAIVLGALLSWRLSSRVDSWMQADKVFNGIWARETPRAASLSVVFSGAVVLLLPALIGWAAYWYFPWGVLFYLKTWAIIAAIAILMIGRGLVIPYFGDVARYVRTSPDAVEARSEIRERGLQLLRELHGVAPDPSIAPDEYDPGSETPYERIVVVGHSLGSIVAYDVLRLLWDELKPSAKKPPSKAVGDALKALDDYLAPIAAAQAAANADAKSGSASRKGPSVDLEKVRELQGAVSKAMATEAGWRISDFVTLGSPLSHAEFLVSRDREAFEERKVERMFPTCPPMMELRNKDYSFLFEHERGYKLPHHAALFAATRWTNIYDPTTLIAFGDFVGGPCAPNFGPGVLDLPVGIIRWPLGRLFTHTDYWNADASGYAVEDVLKQLDPKGDAANLSTIRKRDEAKQRVGKSHIWLLKRAMDLR